MRAVYVLLFCVVALCASPLVRGEGEDVVVLSPDNFDDFINKDLVLVEFFAPWCGHCKSLTPEYAAAATALKSEGVELGTVDATVHGALAGKFEVRGYPTLKIFRNGRVSDYNGPRKADGIISYMKKQVGPASKPVASAADVAALRKASEGSFTVLGFFAGESSQLKSSFNIVSNSLRDDFVFGLAVNQPALAKEYGLTESDGLVALRGDEKFVYTGTSKIKAVEEWIDQNSLAVVGEITEKNSNIYNKRNLPLAKLYLRVDRKPKSQTMRYFTSRLIKVANKFQGKLLFAFANKDDFKYQVDALGLQEEEWGFAIEDNNAQKQYKLESEEEVKPGKKGKTFDAAGIETLCNDFLAGRASAHVKSERAPKNNMDLPVKIATGKNFVELVEDDDKDVLVEFYAPWCGHCKALTPKLEELGKKMKKFKNVLITKIDATANDYDRQKFKVEGYPTIFFRAAGARNYKKYEGPREATDMAKYIKKNGNTTKKKKKKSKKSKKKKDDDEEDDD